MTSTHAYGTVKPKNKPRLVMRKEKKAAMTLFAVMGVFILCVTPYCIVHLAYAYHDTQNLLIALGVTSMLSFINSAANPLIYGILNRKFRRVFVEVIKCHHCPWRGGFQRSVSSTGYNSDPYTGVNASASAHVRQPMIPRDSGYITSAATTQTTSSRSQDIFSISVVATTANTMASIGTNLKDLSRLTAGMTQLPVIEDIKSDEDSFYKTKRRTSNLPVKEVFFNIKEMKETEFITEKRTGPKSDKDCASNHNNEHSKTEVQVS